MSSNSNSSKRSISCDLGLICSSTDHGNWYLISNRTTNGTTSTANMYRPSSTPLVKSTLSGGVYTPQANVKLQYAYRSSSVYMIATNVSTGVSQVVTIYDSRFDTSSSNYMFNDGNFISA